MKVLFLSDLHLGANYIANSRAHENRVVDFLRHEGSDADHIYLLGDVLDYWYEYRTVVPRGFVRFFGELARLADSGVKITWMTGNHDIWLFDYLRDEIGMEVIDAPFIIREIGGQRFLLAHGDRIGRIQVHLHAVPQPRVPAHVLGGTPGAYGRICQTVEPFKP